MKRKKKNKNASKEMIILILLVILIMLIMAVGLYDFVPSDVSIPEPISYTSDSKTTSVKQEIAHTNGGDVSSDTNVTEDELLSSLRSYSIDASDLTIYSEKNLYNSGNSNPFNYAETEESTTNTTTTNTTNSTTNSTTNATTSNATNTTTTTNTASNSTTGTFFESSTSK